jgi:DNA polymerase-4
MRELGIHTGRDLKKFGEAALVRLFGKAGRVYYQNAMGIDSREVVPDRTRKSLGAEETFMADLYGEAELEGKLREIAGEVWRRTSGQDFYGRTVTLKAKYADFRETSKRRTVSYPIEDFHTFWGVAAGLLNAVEFSHQRKIRLMGLYICKDRETGEMEARQLTLDFGEDGMEEV